MINKFIEQAQRGENVFLCDVRDAFASVKTSIECEIKPVKYPSRNYTISLPRPEGAQEEAFMKEYFYAHIYNMISALGGEKISLYIDQDDDYAAALCASLDEVFQVNLPRGQRTGFGKSLNVTDRVNAAMGCPPFRFEVHRGKRPAACAAKENPPPDALASFKKAAAAAQKAALCGIDIGGTDIKLVAVKNGRIAALKEYDWHPASMTTMSSLIEAVLLVAEVMRTALSLPDTERANQIRASLLDKDAPDAEMAKLIKTAQAEFGTPELFDGIGVCFPDVVIADKIVGGETDKMRSIRKHSPDYEKEFAQIFGLDDMLKKICKPGGVVHMSNDGALAAYTAAVELAHSENADVIVNGAFAHTLGTDLGTGWIDETGEIPQIPLEVYNSILDLGNYPARTYNAFDVRSTANFVTGLFGTPSKYTSQFGAYRIALQIFEKEAPALYNELFEKGFVEKSGDSILVVSSPHDMRKALLAHIMDLADKGEPAAEKVFREIGKVMAVIWRETEFVLCPAAKSRVLFGRFVKRKKCFDLMQEGAGKTYGSYLVAGDDDLAHTNLMQLLRDDPVYTVAQFGQAVGAAYYAASGINTGGNS